MSAWVQHIAPEVMDYKGGANMRVAIEKNVYDTGAPKEADLREHMHTQTGPLPLD